MKQFAPKRKGNLRRGNCAAESMVCSKFFQCGLKVELACDVLWLGNIAYRSGYTPKTGIAQKQNV